MVNANVRLAGIFLIDTGHPAHTVGPTGPEPKSLSERGQHFVLLVTVSF